jgi:hypothetical protein
VTYHLAQLNIGRLRAPIGSPEVAEFVAALPEINALAEQAPGFVWRLTNDATDDATAIQAYDDKLIIVNASVWESMEALRAYVYDTLHVTYLRRRREWFDRMELAYTVLWWVPVGHRPTVAEAIERLDLLRAQGSSPDAFTFRDPHPAPGAAPADQPLAGEVAAGIGGSALG